MYGMDKDADGVVDFAEIQAYEKYKKDLLDQANAEEAERLAQKAALKAVRRPAATTKFLFLQSPSCCSLACT